MHARRWTGPVRASRPYPRLALCRTPPDLLSLLLFVFSLAVTGFAGAASNVVQYTYDAAGNITNIQRQTAAGFAITGVSPTSGPVGTAVTIYGTGFSATPANNGVQFNGTAATVSASDAGSISTTVPAGATSGRIAVTVNGVTATSGTDFVVVVPGAPTITSFSPASALSGATVTVAGANFDTTAGGTTVKLNGVTGTSAVTDTSTLTFTVPGGAASGKLTATTALGTGTSATDFVVPPPGLAPADIVSTLRVTPGGGNGNIAVGTAGRSGLVLFDAQPNVFYSIQLAALAMSPTTGTLAYQVIKPDNTVLVTGSIGSGSRPSIHLPMTTAGGTYGLLLSPGNATLNTNIRVDVNPVLTIDGPAAPSTQDFAYQSSRFVFNAAAGQHIGIGLANVAFTPANVLNPINVMRVYRPDGAELGIGPNNSCFAVQSGNPEGDCDVEMLAPVAGTYTAILETPATGYANFAMQLNSEVAGTLTPDVQQAVTLAHIGQDARFAFTVNAGDSLALVLSAAAPLPRPQNISLSVYKPDGSTVQKTCSATPPAGITCELNTLALAGTYSAYVDPAYGAYGAFNLTLKQGLLLLPTDPPSTFAAAGASESMRFRFSATAGQNMTVGIDTLAYDLTSSSATGFSVLAPSGASVGLVGTCFPGGAAPGHCRAALNNLPESGTYSIDLLPPAGVKISGNVNVSAEITGTLVPSTPLTVTASRAGQRARFTFAGSADDSTSVKATAVSGFVTGQTLTISVLKPDGTTLASGNAGNGPALVVNLPSLPVTGTYTVLVDPASGESWQATLTLDPGTPVSIDGAAASPVNVSAGEPLRYTFAATAGQHVEFGFSGLTYASSSTSGTSITAYSPAGVSVMSATCSTTGAGACDAVLASAPTTGRYSIVVAPPVASSITGGSFQLSSPLSGAFVVGDPAQTVAITRTGQTARYTFNGTAAQLLKLTWTSVVITGNRTIAVSILKPDGTTLSSGTFGNGSTSSLAIASLPTSDIYTVVLDPAQAATMSASMSLVPQ